jgi:hypothetical protein
LIAFGELNLKMPSNSQKKAKMGKSIQNNACNFSSIFKSFMKAFYILIFMPFVLAGMVLAQTQSIEMSVESEPDPNIGPSSSVVIPLLHNIENPNDNVFTPYFPNTTVTISFSDFAYSSPTEQDTGDDQPNVVAGWIFNPGGVDIGITSGENENLLVPFDALDESLDFGFSRYDNIGDLEAFYSSTEPTLESGISFTANRGAFISASFAGLDDLTGDDECPYISDQRCEVATMTITFNRPVNNPILHFFGLGSFWEYFIAADQLLYNNAATVEFDLLSTNLGGPASVTLDVLSANPVDPNDETVENAFEETTGLAVSGNSIVSSWNYPDVIDTGDSIDDDAGVANGSIIVRGDGITTLTFRINARAIRDIPAYRNALAAAGFPPEDGFFYGSTALGWNGGADDLEAQEFVDDIDEPVEIPPHNIASDAFILSVSAEVDPDEQVVEYGDSFRMLSSPVRNTSYRELLGEIWVQGPDVTADPEDDNFFSGGDPNIFTWELGREFNENVDEEESNFGWNSNIDITSNIPAGQGFLITVFEDDVYGVDGEFPKDLVVTGSEHFPEDFADAADYSITSNGASDGWMLLGNPFKDPLHINNFLTAHNNNNGGDFIPTIYVWDRGIRDGDTFDGNPVGPGDLVDSGWRFATLLDNEHANYPDSEDADDNVLTEGIDGNVLMPFQGFFIQKAVENATVVFNPDAVTDGGMRDIGAEGTFLRKENENKNSIRLFVSGESVGNPLWLTFGSQGSEERLINDVLELASFNQHFVYLTTQKDDGVALTAGHFSELHDEMEIPVNIEATRPGVYTIKTTDFNLNQMHDLYFVDLVENESIRIDHNFKYTFTLQQAAKANDGDILKRVAKGPQKANVSNTGRFLITTKKGELETSLPDEIALNQNYPNPFNPTTQITYELPQQTDVRLTVYDMVGRQVATLVNETVQAGVHNVNFDASSLSSGVYIYRLQTGSTTLSRKLTVIK